MKLSIIIVNYNVKYFLEQALHAVRKAMKGIESEIFVVDNNSVDGSVKMVREKFTAVKLIENKENKGFSYANNQAIKMASGEFILLLNPDTVVEEDTFEKVLQFMDTHADAGGLGVKMLDGLGKYLPESKRGLPNPAVAFYKIFGLAKLFPKSKTFGRYHLGYLDRDETHEVDVLSGAFMLLRKKVLDKIGLLDEAFFMYGEDIDLSYRIIKAGYKNYYFPKTRIIHYKGESTKKSSVNYVFVFYKAMLLFAKKHFSQHNAHLFSFLINTAIYIRAFFAILSRFIRKLMLPVADACLLFAGMYLLKEYWESNVKHEVTYYPHEYITIAVPCYILVWLTSIYLSGGYDKPIKLSKIVRGIFGGTIFILVVYALLSEEYRFSRALILLSTFWASVALLSVRSMLNFFNIKEFALENQNKKKILIVGSEEESNRVLSLLKLSGANTSFIGYVQAMQNEIVRKYESTKSQITSNQSPTLYCLGSMEQLDEIIEIYQAEEIIFCAKDISSQQIIAQMSKAGTSNREYKIAPPESLSIIGSNSVDNSGDLYVVDINAITKLSNKRNKRTLDIVVAGILLLTFPVNTFFVKQPIGLLKNSLLVLLGKKTWVGYFQFSIFNFQLSNLPTIKQGVLTPVDSLKNKEIDTGTIERLNMLYAKDYRVNNDVNIILKGFKLLGR